MKCSKDTILFLTLELRELNMSLKKKKLPFLVI